MMKHSFLSLFLLLSFCSTASAAERDVWAVAVPGVSDVDQSKGDTKWSRRIVTYKDGYIYIGLYGGEDATSYRVAPDEWVDKSVSRIVTRSAAKGDGYVWLRCKGSANVREKPNINSRIVYNWKVSEEPVKDRCSVLGMEGEWIKIRTHNGTDGYIRQDLVNWDPLHPWEEPTF